MDLRSLPEWADRIVVASIVFGAIVLSAWLFSSLRRHRSTGEVTGSPLCFGVGVMCLLATGVWVWLGLFLTAPGVLERDFLAWVTLVAVFGLSGIAMIASQLGVLARFDATGVHCRRITGRWEHVPWRDFSGVRPGVVLWSGPVFKIKQRRAMLISSDYAGAVELLLAAREAGVPGAKDFFADESASQA